MGPSSPALLPTSCMGPVHTDRSRASAQLNVSCAILYGACQSVLHISNAVLPFPWCSSSPKCVVLGQTAHTQCMEGLGPSKLLASGDTPSSHLGVTSLKTGLTPHHGYRVHQMPARVQKMAAEFDQARTAEFVWVVEDCLFPFSLL